MDVRDEAAVEKVFVDYLESDTPADIRCRFLVLITHRNRPNRLPINWPV